MLHVKRHPDSYIHNPCNSVTQLRVKLAKEESEQCCGNWVKRFMNDLANGVHVKETWYYRMRVKRFNTDFDSLVDLVLLKTFQNLSVSSPAPVTMASPSGDIARYNTLYE